MRAGRCRNDVIRLHPFALDQGHVSAACLKSCLSLVADAQECSGGNHADAVGQACSRKTARTRFSSALKTNAQVLGTSNAAGA